MSEPDRWVRVSGYIEMGLEAVIERFERDDVDRLLESALASAVGVPSSRLQVRGTGPVRVSAANAHVNVTWRIAGPDDNTTQGAGSIALLRVQSGHDPITELLVSVRTHEGDAAWVAASLHGFVENLLGSLRPLAV